jgi:hypothetical protein
MQRRLLAYLKDAPGIQVFSATHSNVFLDNTFVDRAFLTEYSDRILVRDATSKAQVLDDLGYSIADNLVADVLVLCEGPTDVVILKEMLMKTGVLGRYLIKFLILGGDNMNQIDLSVFAERSNTIALVDKDPCSGRVRRQFADKCDEHGIPVRVLQRYAIENYYTLRALRQVFGERVPADLEKLDHRKKLESQLGFNVKRSARDVAREMDLSELEGTDLYDFLREIEELAAAI